MCRCIGFSINVAKTYRAVALVHGNVIPRCVGAMSAIPLVNSFKYLCTDITFHRRAKRSAAAKRVREYCKRAELIRHVHFSQKSALLSGANASLWLAARCAFSAHQHKALQSAGAIKQFYRRSTCAVRQGSRAILHLASPGLHFTHSDYLCLRTKIYSNA